MHGNMNSLSHVNIYAQINRVMIHTYKTDSDHDQHTAQVQVDDGTIASNFIGNWSESWHVAFIRNSVYCCFISSIAHVINLKLYFYIPCSLLVIEVMALL